MSDNYNFETVLETLRKRAIEDAARIDPSVKGQLDADRKEIEEHEQRLEVQRTPSSSLTWNKAAPTEPEPDPEEEKIKERVAKAVADRREAGISTEVPFGQFRRGG